LGCGQPFSRTHSRYLRTLQNLPCQDWPARLRLEVRGELDAETDGRAAVQTVQEALDHRARAQLDALQTREERGVGQLA
jgi:hypothetical protein